VRRWRSEGYAGGELEAPAGGQNTLYWMHLGGGHSVTAHYGIRTHRYKLIYYYGKALSSKGAVETDTPPEWEFFDQKDRAKCEMPTVILLIQRR
jgi:hypothetical protein